MVWVWCRGGSLVCGAVGRDGSGGESNLEAVTFLKPLTVFKGLQSP